MRLLQNFVRIMMIPSLIVVTSILLLQQDQSIALSAPVVQTVMLPPGGFVAADGTVGVSTQAVLTPSLGLPRGQVDPWVAIVQNNRIVVNRAVTTTTGPTATPTITAWQQVNGVLNRSSANVAANPTLTFAGADRATPWVAWRETVDGLHLINAAFFNGSGWTLTPLLNRDTTHNADYPTLTAGAVVSGATALPWAAWAENSASGVPQIVVSQAAPDAGVQGGFRWLTMGDPLNIDPQRNGQYPDLAFAGGGNTTPWVVWTESGAGRTSRVFAKRMVGPTWQSVGRQENCAGNEAACTLNNNGGQDVQMAHIAAGTLPGESISSPWIVFAEKATTGSEIRVLRLDSGDPADLADDRFVTVGGAVNTQCLGAAGQTGLNGVMPDIAFVGNVPHVAWIEQQATGSVLYVCHLADARAGLERWDLLDTAAINTNTTSITAPSLATNGTTPYIAWQEQSEPSHVRVAYRAPVGPAWATSFPGKLRVIAAFRLTAAEVEAIAAELIEALGVRSAAVGEAFLRSQSVDLSTTANHVNGANKIEEVWLQFSNQTQTAFLARYVVAENKVYVQDPDQPGIFLPAVTPGPGAPNLFTRFVTLEAPKLRRISHGSTSPTLELQWSFIFEDAAFFQTYDQAVRLIYDGGQDTGFFKVGTVFVGGGGYLPIILQDSAVPPVR